MQNFNILKNFFNVKPITKNKYDYSYALNIDGVRERVNDSDVFVAVLDKFSLDYVLYLKDSVKQTTTAQNVTKLNLPRRPMYEFEKRRNFNKAKSKDLLNKNLNPDLTTDLREMLAKITRMVYCDLNNLVQNFDVLKNLRQNERETFTNMQNQTKVYMEIVEQIYYALANTSSMPECSDMYEKLPNNFCGALLKVYENIDSLVKKLLRLLRSVQIEEINKQLELMIDTFNNQMNILNNYLVQC